MHLLLLLHDVTASTQKTNIVHCDYSKTYVVIDRVIQMIDENKEQLRNLFRNYNILDVQPAVTGRAPDDLTTLQVSVCVYTSSKSSCHLECLELQELLPLCKSTIKHSNKFFSVVFPDGHHYSGGAALPRCYAVHLHELVLPHSVRTFRSIYFHLTFISHSAESLPPHTRGNVFCQNRPFHLELCNTTKSYSLWTDIYLHTCCIMEQTQAQQIQSNTTDWPAC